MGSYYGLDPGCGTLEIGGQGVFVGKSRVHEYLARLFSGGLARGRLFNHIQLQPIIDVAQDGNTAKGCWRFLAEIGEYQESAIWGGGIYENKFAKEGAIWKIKSLHAYPRFRTPYADGWGKSALPEPPLEKGLLADRPPSGAYGSYPDAFFAPFHYRNPVTRKQQKPGRSCQPTKSVGQVAFRSWFENKCRSRVYFRGNILQGARPSRPEYRTHNNREADYGEVSFFYVPVDTSDSGNFTGGSSSGKIHPVCA